MAKKSRKTAARYSELSKAKKKKQRARSLQQPETVSVSGSQRTDGTKPDRGAAARPAPRTQPELKRGMLSYDYVRSDLKRIGILAGAMIVVLIIVTFVLG